MKLTQLIAAWDALLVSVPDLGELGFCDFELALKEAGVNILNDVPGRQPEAPPAASE